jgi:hypothetical protein
VILLFFFSFFHGAYVLPCILAYATADSCSGRPALAILFSGRSGIKFSACGDKHQHKHQHQHITVINIQPFPRFAGWLLLPNPLRVSWVRIYSLYTPSFSSSYSCTSPISTNRIHFSIGTLHPKVSPFFKRRPADWSIHEYLHYRHPNTATPRGIVDNWTGCLHRVAKCTDILCCRAELRERATELLGRYDRVRISSISPCSFPTLGRCRRPPMPGTP